MGGKNWQDLHNVVKHSQEKRRSHSVACLFKKRTNYKYLQFKYSKVWLFKKHSVLRPNCLKVWSETYSKTELFLKLDFNALTRDRNQTVLIPLLVISY